MYSGYAGNVKSYLAGKALARQWQSAAGSAGRTGSHAARVYSPPPIDTAAQRRRCADTRPPALNIGVHRCTDQYSHTTPAHVTRVATKVADIIRTCLRWTSVTNTQEAYISV